MDYYSAKTLSSSFDEAVDRTTAALKAEGFGIITDIDLKKTFKQKLDIEFRQYRILGACNPHLALEALKLEDKVGTMLPCNVIVQELVAGQVEVAAIVRWPQCRRSEISSWQRKRRRSGKSSRAPSPAFDSAQMRASGPEPFYDRDTERSVLTWA